MILIPIEASRRLYRDKLIKLLISPAGRQYLFNDDLIGKKGNQLVRIAIRKIFWAQYLWAQEDPEEFLGREGDRGEGKDGEDEVENGAGNMSGEHELEEALIELSAEEFLDAFFKELKMPKLPPGDDGPLPTEKDVLRSRRRRTPGPFKILRKMYLEAIKKRGYTSPETDPRNKHWKIMIDNNRDIVRRSWKTIEKEGADAVIIECDDISGSISKERREIERMISWLLEAYLYWTKAYRKIRKIKIHHDTEASIVDRDTYYKAKSGGGTEIASAASLVSTIATLGHPDPRKYFQGDIVEINPYKTAIFVLFYSDGENGDDDLLMKLFTSEEPVQYKNLLVEPLLKKVRMLWYAQTGLKNDYTTSTSLDKVFLPLENAHPDKVRAILIEKKEQSIDALRHFCSEKGRKEVKNG